MKIFTGLIRVVKPISEPCPPNGVLIDGILHPLEGQPPVAHGGTWGNLSFLYSGRAR